MHLPTLVRLLPSPSQEASSTQILLDACNPRKYLLYGEVPLYASLTRPTATQTRPIRKSFPHPFSIRSCFCDAVAAATLENVLYCRPCSRSIPPLISHMHCIALHCSSVHRHIAFCPSSRSNYPEVLVQSALLQSSCTIDALLLSSPCIGMAGASCIAVHRRAVDATPMKHSFYSSTTKGFTIQATRRNITSAVHNPWPAFMAPAANPSQPDTFHPSRV